MCAPYRACLCGPAPSVHPQSHTAAHVCGPVFVCLTPCVLVKHRSCPPQTLPLHRANLLYVLESRGRMAVYACMCGRGHGCGRGRGHMGVGVCMWAWAYGSQWSSWRSSCTSPRRTARLRRTTPVYLAAPLRSVGVCAQSGIGHTRLCSLATVRASSPWSCSIVPDEAPRVSAGNHAWRPSTTDVYVATRKSIVHCIRLSHSFEWGHVYLRGTTLVCALPCSSVLSRTRAA
jgi:hypothetical protein